MGANKVRSWEVAAQPWLVHTNDTAATAFLRSLCGTGGDSAASLTDNANDFSKVSQEQALWAVPVSGDPTHGEAVGSAYIVSAEAKKRLDAHRYSGG
jgi:predicted NodU family carbamoyl transferase